MRQRSAYSVRPPTKDEILLSHMVQAIRETDDERGTRKIRHILKRRQAASQPSVLLDSAYDSTNGLTALMSAALVGNYRCCEELLEKASVGVSHTPTTAG